VLRLQDGDRVDLGIGPVRKNIDRDQLRMLARACAGDTRETGVREPELTG
jgi:hypothetical protein